VSSRAAAFRNKKILLVHSLTDGLLMTCIYTVGIQYIVVPLIEMYGCDWFKSRHVV